MIYSNIHPVSCTNTHHDVTNLLNRKSFKIQKLEYLKKGTKLFYEIKKILMTHFEKLLFCSGGNL